jgi:hypothetical protein
MASVKESERVPRARKRELTREVLEERLKGQPGFRVPRGDCPPFRKFKPADCRGVAASELLISDRR